MDTISNLVLYAEGCHFLVDQYLQTMMMVDIFGDGFCLLLHGTRCAMNNVGWSLMINFGDGFWRVAQHDVVVAELRMLLIL